MKELTIEQKAKAYDEALSRAKGYHTPDCHTNLRIAMENLFPELKESEDERIRKSLIDMLKNDEKCYLKEIAWLEEQGQHKKFRDSIQVGDKVTRNEDGVLVNLSQLNRVAKKQGEQKPADKIESRQEELTKFEKAVKQIMEEAIECGDTHNLKADADMLLRLIQKPWSEEDEKMIRALVSMCDVWATSNQFYPKENKEMEAVKTWLKSLRFQNHWKPSETQLETLKELSQDVPIKRGIIEELLEQLKKLMEE